MNLFKLFLAVTAALVVAAPGADAADPFHGKDLAQRWCAACHVVAPGQTSASADVPPFMTIARSPNFSAAGIAYFLLDPHPKMPTLPLSRIDADDLAAYMQTLKE